MINKKLIILFIFLFNIPFLKGQNIAKKDFDRIEQSAKWNLKFKDSGTKNWETDWFLDGQRASIKNSEQGMNFGAGPTAFNDTCHAVLWTKKSFKGDIKIEYNYTRTDKETKQVNILYIQASGIDVGSYTKDISEWDHLRVVPSMKTYFNYMNALHISYAAFGQKNNDITQDYIRVRKYPRIDGENFNKTTEISPAYFNTGLFKTGVTYKITVIKTGSKLFFKVTGDNELKLYSWDLKAFQIVKEGRIGLRHMYTRSARYRNFKVFTK